MKKILTAMLIGAIILTVAYADEPITFNKSNYTITIDGRDVDFDNDTYIKDFKNYAPLRSLCYELDMPITLDEENGTIDIHNESIKMEPTAQINESGLVVPTSAAALEIAKIIFEQGMGVLAEGTENGRIYELRPYFIESKQEWFIERMIVGYEGVTAVPADEIYGRYYAPAIWISAKTGEVRKIR